MRIPNRGEYKRINIIGSAPGFEDAPVDDGEIWGVNNTHLLRNVDRIIDIHFNRSAPTEEKDQIHMAEIRNKLIPTYTNGVPDAENIFEYPLQEIIEEFDSDYFGSGIDYIIALAVYEGATEIHMYGVMMELKGEYAHQKPSVEHWIGIAKGRGVKFVVHGERTTILRTCNGLMYGYQTPQAWVKKHHPDHIHLIDLLEKYEKED